MECGALCEEASKEVRRRRWAYLVKALEYSIVVELVSSLGFLV